MLGSVRGAFARTKAILVKTNITTTIRQLITRGMAKAVMVVVVAAALADAGSVGGPPLVHDGLPQDGHGSSQQAGETEEKQAGDKADLLGTELWWLRGRSGKRM